MSTTAVARRYAQALFEIARDENKLDAIAKELAAFAAAYECSEDFRQFEQLPGLSDEARGSIVVELGKSLKASDATTRTMTLLAQRQRLSTLPDLVAAYNALSDEHQGILRATVRAAKPLASGYLQRLTKKIEEATGKKVVAEFQLDDSLIAGVVTQIGDRIVDGSVRGKLEQLRQSLRAT